MPTSLTVCGSSGSLPGAGRACSGYFLRNGDAQLVLDLGNGALSNLLRWVEPESITDVVISHGHHDHFADLVGLLQLTSYGVEPPPVVRVYGTSETCRILRAVQTEHAPNTTTFDLVEIRPGESVEAGGFMLEAFPTWHSQPGILSRVTDAEGTVIAYTGDSDLSDDLVRGAEGAQLLVSEATWLADAGDYPVGVHMNGRQAGELARRAGVARLLVTHVWPELDPVAVASQAAETFEGPTIVAEDGLVMGVRSSS